MTAVKTGDVDALIRRGPDPAIILLLVYGPDTGLVADRVAALIKRFVADPDDPFALIQLDGDTLASDPGRLIDEAGTGGLFGESRTIRVRTGSRSIGPAIDALLTSNVAQVRVVVEAGDLARSAPLRTLCEKSSKALTLPCYADDPRMLAGLIERQLSEHGLAIEPDARDLLASSLGGDRRASLSEIEKLALYARGQSGVSVDDIEAVASDVAASTLNTLIDAAFAGQISIVENELRRFRSEGLDPSAMLGAALRQGFSLLAIRLDNPGASPSVMAGAWRGLHFRRRGTIETQLAAWSPDALRRALEGVQDAILACRRSGSDLAQAQASVMLLRIAGEATRRRR